MKKLYTILCLSILTCAAFGEMPDSSATPKDTSWKKGGFVNINTSQTGLSNWAAGGQNSFALGATLNLFANYEKGKIMWNTGLTLGYAELEQGSTTRISDDRIDLTSKFGRQTSKYWYLTVLGNFKSQFTNGYNYPNDSVPVSNFFAPAYVLASIGFDFKPNDDFSLYLSPATGRFIFVSNTAIADLGTYGNMPAVYATDGTLITHGLKSRSEFGAYLKAGYKRKLMENVTMMAKVDLFNDYTDNIVAERKNVVVNGELLISLKVNKWLSASVDVITIYDNDVDTDPNEPGIQRRLQVEDVIGVGLAYQF